MSIKLIKQEVGPWPMNMYILICEQTRASVIIDPGADLVKIMKHVEGTQVDKIILTHGHPDHVGVLDEIKQQTDAPVYIHPIDAEHFGINFDVAISDGDDIMFGSQRIRAVHTPGHTQGMISLDLGDGRVIVGDTIFVGGPGRTWSAEDFETTMRVMQETVFQWPDETVFFPGHGPNGKIGKERPAFETFVARGWSPDTQGDVTWK